MLAQMMLPASYALANENTVVINRHIWGDSTQYKISVFKDAKNRIALCVQNNIEMEEGTAYNVTPWINNKKVVWLVKNAPKTVAELDKGQNLNGKVLSGADLIAVYTMAIWTAAPDAWERNRPDEIYGDAEAEAYNHRSEIRPTVEWLVAQAESHANDADLKSTDILWLTHPDSQNLVILAPVGYAKLHKSAN